MKPIFSESSDYSELEKMSFAIARFCAIFLMGLEKIYSSFFSSFFQKITDYSRMRGPITKINIVGDSPSDDKTFGGIEFCVGSPSGGSKIPGPSA